MLYVWYTVYMAAVRQIGFSKESYLDTFGIWGANCIHVYLHTHQISWEYLDREQNQDINISILDQDQVSSSGAEIIFPENEIRNRPSGGGILLPVQILTSVIFRGPCGVWPYKISRKPLNARLNYICDSTFSIGYLPLNLGLHCQRHDTVPQCRLSITNNLWTESPLWIKSLPMVDHHIIYI